MDNQHAKIQGYRDLSQDEIDLINEIKAMSNQVGALVEKLDVMCNRIRTAENAHLPVLDGRWVNIGTMHLQEGFMSLIRSVAKPTTF